MGKVSVNVNGYAYDVACEDGQEPHLKELATYVNKRVGELRGAVGDVGEARLLVMAAILIADEASDAFARADDLAAELATARDSKEAEVVEAQEAMKARIEARNQALTAAMVNGLAERIESIAERLE